MNLVNHLWRARRFSENTFGPGQRTEGIVAHIREELEEVLADPSDLFEWIDIVILALDGAWRQGYEPEEIAYALAIKQKRNERRQWPDWRKFGEGEAIKHIKPSAD